VKRFLPLLLCLIVSIFTVVRATKPAHIFAPGTKGARTAPTGQQADVKALIKVQNTAEEVTSDDDESTEGTSNDDGESTNDDNDDDAAGDQDTGDDDGGSDDDGGDDDGGDGGE
jgi:hypothetical protein